MTTLLALVLLMGATPATSAQCLGWSGFGDPVRYSVTADQALLIADLDGDGAAEIITSGNQVEELGTFSILRNRGDGTFAPEQLLASNFGERVEALGDLDADGVADLVVSNYWSNGIAVYKGKGGLTFEAGVPYQTATHGGPSMILDYDGDGIPDVVSLSYGSGNPVRVHFFRGHGDGTLGAKTTIDTTLGNGASPSVRTINGALEILVSERFGDLGVLHFAGGILSVSRIGAGPGFDLASAFADLNGDGVADIVNANDTESDGASPGEPIFVRLGNADGTFGELRQIGSTRHVGLPVTLRVTDLDGDGHPDLVASDFQASTLFLFRGDGEGNFAAGVAVNAGGPVNRFEVADVNGDGRPDIVTVNNDHSVSVLINRGACSTPRRRASGR